MIKWVKEKAGELLPEKVVEAGKNLVAWVQHKQSQPVAETPNTESHHEKSVNKKEKKPIRHKEENRIILSLGAGVQSSVMALMAARGEMKIPPTLSRQEQLEDWAKVGKKHEKDYIVPEVAIFADTGWEPQKVYDHLDWLEAELKKAPNPIKIIRVSNQAGEPKGTIREDLLNGENSTGQSFISIPLFTKNKDGKNALIRRQCTREYKLEPLRRGIRDHLKLEKRQRQPFHIRIEQWVGISTDEIIRVKRPRHAEWQLVTRWPLIEMGMSRQDCHQWFKKHYPNRPLPRSACIGCPLRSNKEWKDMKDNDPESFAKAKAIDEQLRTNPRTKSFHNGLYIHSSLIPLKDVKFEDYITQKEFSFENECEGMCGM